MALATTPLVPKDGTIVFSDGAALTYTLVYEDGDLQVSDLKESQWVTQVFKDRGIPYSARDVERDEAIEFSFTAHAIGVVGDNTTATIGDVVMRLKVWAAATSTMPASTGDVYTVQLAWTGERTDLGATADTTLTLKYCRLSMDFAEGVPGKISVKGRAICYSTDYLTVS